MSKSLARRSALLTVIVVAALFAPHMWGAEEPESLIVTCARPCQGVATAVSLLGGEITQVYDNVDAVAVSVPQERVAELAAAVGADAVHKDALVSRPSPIEPTVVDGAVHAEALTTDALDGLLQVAPENYNYNSILTNAASLHASGLLGQNVVVATIDTGAQMVADALGPAGTGSVIGGENFVPLTTDPVASATSRLNDWHGTSVATMIAAHASFVFANTSRLVQSLLVHSPSSVLACPGPPYSAGCPAGASIVPMIGMAPAAKIYALKVFSSRGGGSPESRIIAALDRALTLRRNFDNGVSTAPVGGTGTENDPYRYNALNIKVVNMSLGGLTFFAGHDVEDELTEALLDAGIVVTSAAGNSGFGAMTIESPATGLGSLAVAAANTPVHERVLRDQSALGLGVLYRPSNQIQTAYFSSRGPIPDGRTGPHLIANGFASYTNAFAAIANNEVVSCGSPLAPTTGANACASRILFVSGTSFSTPTVAGAAALLRGAVPGASASQVRRALIDGANPFLLGDRSDRFDQGAGFLDVQAALAELHSGHHRRHGECDDDDDDRGPDHDRGRGHGECRDGHRRDHHDDGPDDVGDGGGSVIRNVREAGQSIVQFREDQFTALVPSLVPGQVQQFFIPADDRTDKLTVKITQITPGGVQNALFGDDLFVMAIDAPTSEAVDRIEPAFVAKDTTYVIDNPQTGLVRLALQGDWTNASPISARVTIERQRSPLARRTASGVIRQDDVIPVTVNIPSGVSQAVFELFWQQNWGRFPTNDLDMVIIRPDGTLLLDSTGLPPGATESSPERAVVTNPTPGAWTVVIDGFTIHDNERGPRLGRDQFSLRVTADGRPIVNH